MNTEEVQHAIRQICCKRIETLSNETCEVVDSYLLNTDKLYVRLRVNSGVAIANLEQQLLNPKDGFESINLKTGRGSVWHGEMTGCTKIYTDFKLAVDPVFAERMKMGKQAFERKLGAWVILGFLLTISSLFIWCAWISYDKALGLTQQWQTDAKVPAAADLLYATLITIFT